MAFVYTPLYLKEAIAKGIISFEIVNQIEADVEWYRQARYQAAFRRAQEGREAIVRIVKARREEQRREEVEDRRAAMPKGG